MKLTTFSLSFAAGLAMFATTGCISFFRSEGPFTPSPNGQFVVSEVSHQTSLQIPAPEQLELGSSVSVRVRNREGKELFTVPFAKGSQSNERGYVSPTWSPDGNMLAYCCQGRLTIIDIANQKSRKLLDGVSSFRWVGTSNLCCISGLSGRGGQVCVSEISSSGEVGVSRMFNFRTNAINSIASEEGKGLSPDSGHLVFMDETQILVQSLKGTTNRTVLQRKQEPGSCWWTDSSDKCLLSGLEKVKTTKAWPEDTTFRNVVYLYETKSASFRDISELLRQLNYTNYSSPMPRESCVWSPQGNWFLVSGPGDWVCMPEPWSFVCLQKVLSPNFGSPKIAPSGSCIAMVSMSTQYAETGDLVVTEIRVDANGKISIGIPRKIAAGIPAYSWFWSADGKELIVWTGRKFIHHSIPTQP